MDSIRVFYSCDVCSPVPHITKARVLKLDQQLLRSMSILLYADVESDNIFEFREDALVLLEIMDHFTMRSFFLQFFISQRARVIEDLFQSLHGKVLPLQLQSKSINLMIVYCTKIGKP